MAKRYLIDTNVIIDFSANLIPKKGSSLLSICFDEEPIISVITKIELAATALTLDLILLSRNTVDFSKIKALNHLNPYKL
ncbi:MAG TPA: hypothetical protein DHV26_09040 [Cytophagales bacterium]|nr:hypothetical protein [Cytophagales bacterium]HRG09544.1 hypothetical protein [Cyclobacteriaceae bacterium]